MMDIQKATVDDVDALVIMEKKYFHAPWTKEQFEYELTNNCYSNIMILKENDYIIGYIDYWIVFDQAQINKICVDENYRKQGLGKKMIDFAFAQMKANQVFSITLEVRVSNIPAQHLYEKLGFKTILTKKAYYSDGEDAFFMVKGGYEL